MCCSISHLRNALQKKIAVSQNSHKSTKSTPSTQIIFDGPLYEYISCCCCRAKRRWRKASPGALRRETIAERRSLTKCMHTAQTFNLLCSCAKSIDHREQPPTEYEDRDDVGGNCSQARVKLIWARNFAVHRMCRRDAFPIYCSVLSCERIVIFQFCKRQNIYNATTIESADLRNVGRIDVERDRVSPFIGKLLLAIPLLFARKIARQRSTASARHLIVK